MMGQLLSLSLASSVMFSWTDTPCKMLCLPQNGTFLGWLVCAHGHGCVYVCLHKETRDQSWVSFLRILSTLFCETGSLIDLEFTGLAGLPGQGVPEIYGLRLPHTGTKSLPSFFTWVLVANSCSHICMVSTYQLSYLPSPLCNCHTTKWL